MLCPMCKIELRMTDRQGVEIDYCPQCRGVWLDRGELDKLLEREAMLTQAPAVSERQREPDRLSDYRDRDRGDYRERDSYRDGGGYPRKKKGGWLGELFEFGD